MIAALYVDPRGPYPALLGASACWDETRDARRYEGPHAIIAHPDCGPWGKLRHLYRGHGHDCAPRAVEQVRRWGGVLEHPAGSRLWTHASLPRPGAPRDAWGGWTEEVCQVDWGHVARKRTWLYCVGVDRALASFRPPPGTPTHWVSGRVEGRISIERAREKGYYGGFAPRGTKICSAELRRRTPIGFAHWLRALADSVPRRWPWLPRPFGPWYGACNTPEHATRNVLV